jgi:PGF-pre-PGF domain-containing protein
MKKKGDFFNLKFLLLFLLCFFLTENLSALSIVSSDYTLTDTSVQVHISFSENANMSMHYGTTTDLNNVLSEVGYSNSYTFEIGALTSNTTYYWNVFFCNNLNECNSTGLFNLTTLSPNNDMVYPQFSNYWDNNGSLIDSGTASLNVTVSQTNGSVILNFGGQNFAATNNSGNPTVFNVSFPVPSGGVYTYYWKSYGNGTSNNYNRSENRKYTVNISSNSSSDTTSPVIQIIYPVNNSNLTSSSTVFFSFNVTDQSSIANCSLILDGSSSLTDTSITRNISQGMSYSLSNSVYTWKINCTDSLNNIGTSSVYSLRVNYTSSNVTSNNTINNSTNSSELNSSLNLAEDVPFSLTKNFSVITSENPASENEINPLFGMIGFSIKVNAEARDVLLIITRFDQKPGGVSTPKNTNVYKYLEIHSENLTDALNAFTINFIVYKNWTDEKNIPKENISLFHLNSSSMIWTEVPTSLMAENSDSYSYSAEVNSFSYFYLGQSLSESERASSSSFLDFIKSHFIWIISFILLGVLIFVIIRFIVPSIKKSKNKPSSPVNPSSDEPPKAEGFVPEETSSPLPPPTIDEILKENETLNSEKVSSFEENKEQPLPKQNPPSDSPQNKQLNSPSLEPSQKMNSEDLKKEISGLRNKINEKDKRYSS